MLRLCLPAMMVLLCLEVTAQSLNRNQVMSTGDQFTRYEVSTVDFDPGNAGENQVWDFSHLSHKDADALQITIAAPGTTSAAASFPSANLAEVRESGDDVHYQYWQVDQTQLQYLGYATERNTAPFTTNAFTDSARTLNFPASLGDQHTDTLASTFSQSGVAFTWTGTLSVHVDGAGKLILPSGSYADVVRVKTVQEVDQTATATGLPYHITTITYAWHDQHTGYPLLSYQQQVLFTKNGQETTKRAFYTQATATLQDRMIAHLAAFGGDFNTSLFVRNNGTVAGTVTLHAYASDGTAGNPFSVTLNPGEVRRVSHQEVGSNTSHLGISGSTTCTVTVGYQAATGGGTAHIHETTAAQEFLVYPGEWDVLFDGLALVNLGTQSATITGYPLDTSGNTIGAPITLAENLPPGSKTLANFSSTFSGTSPRLIRVTSTQDAAAIFLRGSLDGRFLYQNLPLRIGESETRWIPHLAAFGGDFTTEVFVHNLGSEPGTTRLLPFADGLALDAVDVTLSPGQTRVLTQEELGSAAQLIEVTGGGSCVVTVGYRAATGGGTAHIHQTQGATQWVAYPGEWDTLWDGLALANTGGGTARFYVDVLSDTGNTVFTSQLDSREDNQKLLLNLSIVLRDNPNLTMRIRSNRKSILLLLRGSLDGKFLYHNIAL